MTFRSTIGTVTGKLFDPGPRFPIAQVVADEPIVETQAADFVIEARRGDAMQRSSARIPEVAVTVGHAPAVDSTSPGYVQYLQLWDERTVAILKRSYEAHYREGFTSFEQFLLRVHDTLQSRASSRFAFRSYEVRYRT